jgi:hypothetical protein
MPANKPTAKNGFPCDPKKCRANRHLKGNEYIVYDAMFGFAIAGRTSLHGDKSTEPLHFNASIKPKLCNALAMSVNNAYKMKDRLVELGWLVLVKEGERRRDGSTAPDTYRIFTHEEFVAANPETCPPYEFAPDFETAQAHGLQYGQRLRPSGPVPDNLFPKPTEEQQTTANAIAAFLDSRTPEQQAALVEHWKSRSPITDVMDFVLPVPKSRVRHQSLNLGNGPAPQLEDGQSLNCETPSPAIGECPVPKLENTQSLNLGKNPTTTPVTATAHTQHTPANPQGVRVCVNGENLSAMDLDIEVGKLVEGFVKHNSGDPGQITSKQREQLKELLRRHGRETFRGAALVWLKDSPWNNQTTHPFVSLISGFEGYAAKIVYDKKRAAQKAREAIDGDSTSKFWGQKIRVDHEEKLLDPRGEYLASLPQEDRDYIAKVAAANTLAEMPPDNGKQYPTECIEFYKKQREEEAAMFKKDVENGTF